MRKLRWDSTPRKLPAHPYRDSAILYGVFACVLIGMAALTGGNLRTALIVAPAVFVAATAYSWWRWRAKIRQETERQ